MAVVVKYRGVLRQRGRVQVGDLRGGGGGAVPRERRVGDSAWEPAPAAAGPCCSLPTFLSVCLRAACRAICCSTALAASSSESSPSPKTLAFLTGRGAAAALDCRTVSPYLTPFCPISMAACPGCWGVGWLLEGRDCPSAQGAAMSVQKKKKKKKKKN